MRLDSLTIPAFGHFSDFSLQFPKSKYDVHLIYGPNEAGKSSLLRAVNNLFFGIPTRTSDNFLHPNAKLLIGATISDESETLSFFRKKGTKNTLLDVGQSTLEDSALAPFLGSVNEEFFKNMFGLNTESLRAGALELLSGKGDLGTMIFRVALGGSPIDDAIKKLEAEADLLFKGRSTKASISLAIKAHKDAERAARDESTTVTAWRFLQTEVKNAHATFTEKDQLHRAHRARWQFVENCLGALPILAVIRELESRLAGIEAPELPSDFPKRVRDLQSQFAGSSQAYQLQNSQIENAENALGEIANFAPVLAATADFETLQRKAEQHLENLEELPGLKASLSGLDLDDLPAVRSADQALMAAAADSLIELTRQSSEVTRTLENLEIELTAQREQLTEASDISELEEQCRRADDFAAEKSSLPGLEENLAALRSEQGTLGARLEVEGDPVTLKIPGAKTIQSEAREHERLDAKIHEIEGRLTDLRDVLAEEQTSLDHLASQAAIYSQADLSKSREERDAIWAGILKSKNIEESLTGAISHSDEVADTLRNHADHNATAAGHQAKISQFKSKQGNLEADLEKAQKDLNDWQAAWEAQSRDLSPVALLEWREEWEKLCDLIREAESLDLTITALQKKEASLLQDLGGEDFSQVHRALKAALNRANQEKGERNLIQKQVSKNEVKQQQLTQEAKSLKVALESAEETWNGVCESTGISPELPPKAAVEALNERARAREIFLDFESRNTAVEAYQDLLKSLGDRFKVEALEPALTAFHEQSRIDQDRAKTLQVELDQLTESFPEIKLSHKSDVAALEALAEQAGTENENFEPVLHQIEIRNSLVTRLDDQKAALQNLAGATPLDDFLGTLEDQDAEELTQEKVTLDQSDKDLQLERDQAKAGLDEHLRSEEEMMKANDVAAIQKQASADALASVVADTQRYRQLHYAIDFLKQQVDDYRQKTQGPMVEKTSSFFKALTSGAFAQVAAQVDEKNQPQLIAIRAGGEAVATSGLSEGTADQLYLALRLAAISLHLENHPPIPLILDDLLMTFDDERTKALIPVLEELSQQTQILIFTHHSHLKDLVGSNVSSQTLL
jgi:uncharacterized protein YhaN